MNTSGRIVAGLLVVGIAVAGPLGAAPAFAVTAPPAPVDPISNLPSQLVKVFPDNPEFPDRIPDWMVSERDRIKSTPGAKPRAPITAADAMRNAKGNAIISGLSAGFVLGETGLRIWADSTGSDPLPGVCGSGLEGISSVIYPDLMPDCTPPVAKPNEGVEPGWSAAVWNGGSVRMTKLPSKNSDGCIALELPRSWMNGAQEVFIQFDASDPGTRRRFTAAGQWHKDPNHHCFGLPAGVTGGAYGVSPNDPSQYGRPLVFRGADGKVLGSTPTEKSDDPIRQSECVLRWPDGRVKRVIGVSYRESQGFPLGALNLACQAAAADTNWDADPPSKLGVESVDTETGATTEIAGQDVPEFGPGEKIGLTPGDGTGLILIKDVNGTEDNCLTWAADCRGWWPKTNQGTKPTTQTEPHPETYYCRYGGRAVPLTECAPYQKTFDGPKDKPTVRPPGTDVDIPWTGTETPGGSTNPGSTLPPGEVCMREWPSTPNPVDWILHPIKCALVWAFVPREAVVKQALQTSEKKWSGTMPGKLPGVVQSVFVVPNVRGCEGLTIHIPLSGLSPGWVDIHWTVLNACSGAPATVAALARTIGAAVLIFLTALGIIRRASATVNAPGVGG